MDFARRRNTPSLNERHMSTGSRNLIASILCRSAETLPGDLQLHQPHTAGEYSLRVHLQALRMQGERPPPRAQEEHPLPGVKITPLR